MIRVSATDFQREVGRYQDLALTQPVTVTRNGRDRTVMISADEYQRLMMRDRRVLKLEDVTDEDLALIEAAEPPAHTAQFDQEMER